MGVFNAVFPIPPGKEAAVRAWVDESARPRREGFDALNRRGGVTRETVTTVTTPTGSFLLTWFEGDIQKAFTEVATAQDAYTVWHRGRVQELFGLDANKPPEGPPPELLLDWRA